MSLLKKIHGDYVFSRRVRVVSDSLSNLISSGESVLDIGCGNGQIASLIGEKCPGVTVQGLDVLVRSQTYMPVAGFDGNRIPYDDNSFDVVMFVDVLHHTDDPMILLREAVRVARAGIVIKDHLKQGMFAESTLRIMDWVGNSSYGVALPYNYWPLREWMGAFAVLNLKVSSWKKELKLYPVPARWVFDRSLHFVARLELIN